MFTRVWGVLLAFRYVFTNLVKYRYAEGHVFAAAAPKRRAAPRSPAHSAATRSPARALVLCEQSPAEQRKP